MHAEMKMPGGRFKFGLLVIGIIATLSAFGQRDIYVTRDGHMYSKKQWDSVWYASGDWVELERRRRSQDTIEMTLIHINQADFIADICKSGRCDEMVYDSQPHDGWDKSFFKRVASVKVTSFKRAPLERYNREIPQTNHVVDLSLMFEAKDLEDDLKDLLFKVMHHYHLDTMEISPASCYEPRNAVVFMDNHKAVIGYIELCFGCQRFRVVPDMLGIKEGFFYEQWEAIRRIFMMAGIKYGVDRFERD